MEKKLEVDCNGKIFKIFYFAQEGANDDDNINIRPNGYSRLIQVEYTPEKQLTEYQCALIFETHKDCLLLKIQEIMNENILLYGRFSDRRMFASAVSGYEKNGEQFVEVYTNHLELCLI